MQAGCLAIALAMCGWSVHDVDAISYPVGSSMIAPCAYHKNFLLESTRTTSPADFLQGREAVAWHRHAGGGP